LSILMKVIQETQNLITTYIQLKIKNTSNHELWKSMVQFKLNKPDVDEYCKTDNKSLVPAKCIYV
jgi:Holliday junction resolvase RusA-like endonuclease